jgi:hypothetical protein
MELLSAWYGVAIRQQHANEDHEDGLVSPDSALSFEEGKQAVGARAALSPAAPCGRRSFTFAASVRGRLPTHHRTQIHAKTPREPRS